MMLFAREKVMLAFFRILWLLRVHVTNLDELVKMQMYSFLPYYGHHAGAIFILESW